MINMPWLATKINRVLSPWMSACQRRRPGGDCICFMPQVDMDQFPMQFKHSGVEVSPRKSCMRLNNSSVQFARNVRDLPLGLCRPWNLIPQKWSTISVNVGHWIHPQTQQHVQFLMEVDEGSRFRVGHMILTRKKSHVIVRFATHVAGGP